MPHTHRITHWSARFLGAELGVSFATVARIWCKCGLQPHRIETFRFSTDPELEPKIRDIAGLYLDPPANALVAEGFSCVLAGARQVMQLPGPAEAGPRPIPRWLATCFERGGVTPCFVAAPKSGSSGCTPGYRRDLTEERTREKKRRRRPRRSRSGQVLSQAGAARLSALVLTRSLTAPGTGARCSR